MAEVMTGPPGPDRPEAVGTAPGRTGGQGAVAEVMTRPARACPARNGRHRARPHEGPGAVASVRVDEKA